MEKYEYYTNQITAPEAVLPKKIYYAYKGGKSFPCNSLCEAKKYPVWLRQLIQIKKLLLNTKRR